MRLLSILVCIGLTLCSLGCSVNSKPNNSQQPIIATDKQQEQAAHSSDASKKTIALVMKTLTNPFFIEMEKGARKAAKELDVNVVVKTGAKETSIDQQIAIINELIQMKVDAIVIAPASSSDLIPVLKKAQEAHIAIINIDNQLDPSVSAKLGLTDVPYISVNNEQGAYLSAKYISDSIHTPTQAVILEGITEAQNSQDRKAGALRAFQENPNISVVSVVSANWKIDEAYNLTAQLYKEHRDIGAFFCANDMMALGVVKYLKQTGKTTVPVAGYDALTEAKQAIKEGQLAATIDQQADIQGYLGIKYAYQRLHGETVPLQTLVDVKLLHAGNIN